MFLYDLIYHHGYRGISPNYRKYAISYLSIVFNNSALQFWCTVHLRLLRTPLVSPLPSECHSGIYKGCQCTEDIETLSTLSGVPFVTHHTGRSRPRDLGLFVLFAPRVGWHSL